MRKTTFRCGIWAITRSGIRRRVLLQRRARRLPPRAGAHPGTYSKYNSIDDKIDDFFYYTTYIKYGIGRTTYDAAQEIRNEEITLDEGKALCKKFDGEYPDRFEKEIFKYLSLDRQHFPWASQLFEQPRMDRDYFMDLADRFRSPHIWKWEDNMWKLRHTPYEGDSEVLWGDPRGTHHEI